MTRRMRIASLIADLGFGGSENRVLSFARTIDRSRFDHVVITLYRPEESYEPNVGSLRRTYAEAGVEIIHLAEKRRGRMLPSLRPADMFRAGSTLNRLVRRLCRVVRERGIDLIDAQHATATLFGVLAGCLTRRPTTITQYFPYYFDRPGMRLLGQAVFARADAFICDSRAQSDLINRWLFRPHRRSLVIPNGIPVPTVTRASDEMRRLLELPTDRSVRVVGQVSRLIPYKGQRVLLRAAREILFEEPNTYFVLTGYANGDQAYIETLRRDASELGIADRLRIVSWPGSIGDVWQLIDVHVHASLQDSLPIAITEGMSFGKPAVVTNVGGVEEMVTHEQTGLVVPMNDPGALARGVVRLLKEPETARRLGTAAQERYQQSYRPESMARALEALFVELIERDHANARWGSRSSPKPAVMRQQS
jgi:glycosyltransferase involved in cell wall biosynthesis